MGDAWWRDREQFQRRVIDPGHSNADAHRAYGQSEALFRKWRQVHGYPPSSDRGAATPRAIHQQGDDPNDQWLLDALKARGDHASVEELADHADCPPRRVREALERLGHDGYRVEEEDSRVAIRRVPPPSNNVHRALFAGETIRLGVVGDTHLSSKHERLEELHIAYDVFVDEGITDVLHLGDLSAGIGIFPGQVNEIQHHTFDDQVAYAVANYPHRPSVKTRLIGGNHDLEGQAGKVGLNPTVAVCNQRDDIEYLGDYRATIELEQGTRIYMLHPKGGMGYAADYKVRKIAEGFEAGAKPNVLLVGHFHRRFDIEARGIQCLGTGCFEGGGAFGARLGLSDPAVGFHIVEMRVGDDGSVVKWSAEWNRLWPGRSVERKKT